MSERTFTYRPKGVCATRIDVTLDDDNIVRNIEIINGCDGNHKGIIALSKGQKAEDLIAKLSGISCGLRPTSCPDQLAQALKAALQ